MHRKSPAVLAAGTVLPACHLVSLSPSPWGSGKQGTGWKGAVVLIFHTPDVTWGSLPPLPTPSAP